MMHPMAAAAPRNLHRESHEPAQQSAIYVLPWDVARSSTPAPRAGRDDGTAHPDMDPRSVYVETFWLPILGPTATFVLRKLADRFDLSPEGFVVDQSELAASIGIGGPGSRHAPLRRALQRCARYGFVRPGGPGAIEARRVLSPVPRHRLTKLPAILQAMHRDWEAAFTRRQLGGQRAEPAVAVITRPCLSPPHPPRGLPELPRRS